MEQDIKRLHKLIQNTNVRIGNFVVAFVLIVLYFWQLQRKPILWIAFALILTAFVTTCKFKSPWPKVGIGFLVFEAILALAYEYRLLSRPPNDQYTLLVGLIGISLIGLWFRSVIRFQDRCLEAAIQKAGVASQRQNGEAPEALSKT